MAFDSLSEKLSDIFRRLKGRGKLSEADVNEVLREIKLALLGADVNFKVVKAFVESVRARAVGEEVTASLTPAQQVIKIVHEELCRLMGEGEVKLNLASKPPTVILLCGLQGAGKTTHAAKLGYYCKTTLGRRPLLVACDVYRPAAVDQLKIVGETAGVPVYSHEGADPVAIAREGVEHAKKFGNDIVILDTAGRLHVDAALMEELSRIKEATHPQEILLVVDAMTGQDAVHVAQSFHEQLGVTGVILTKFDGDTRGGAAMSVRYITGAPVKFVGVGETVKDLELFYPDRMASRILGMGDMLSLIEKAEAAYEEEEAKKLEEKLRKNAFDLEDYYGQLAQMKKMGGVGAILGNMGVKQKDIEKAQIDEKMFERQKAIILSMTPQERRKPDLLAASRKRRIAAGAGVEVSEVNRLLKNYEQTRMMIKKLNKNPKAFGNLGGFGNLG